MRYHAGLSALACAFLAACSTEPTSIRAPVVTRSLPATPSEFKIAVTPVFELAPNAASDGVNALVPYVSDTIVRMKLVSGTGTILSALSTGHHGEDPEVAFDGTNYLVAWLDETDSLRHVYGEFVSTAGAKVGVPFKMASAPVNHLLGLAYGGGHYLVVYRDSGFKLVGRLMTPAKAFGRAHTLAPQVAHNGLNVAASDGTDFLVSWVDGTSPFRAVARLVRSDGTLGATRVLDGSVNVANDEISIAYGGGVYLVMWNVSVGSTGTDPYARIVTSAGALSGNSFAIDTTVGRQVGISIVATHDQFLCGWISLFPSGRDNARFRFVTTAGVPAAKASTLFAIDSTTGKVPIPRPVSVGSQVFFAVNRAIVGSDPFDINTFTDFDVYGEFQTVAP